jgi:hypothetical protein
MFLFAWALSVAYWKLGRMEQRTSLQVGPHIHIHAHADGSRHSHDHLHSRAE